MSILDNFPVETEFLIATPAVMIGPHLARHFGIPFLHAFTMPFPPAWTIPHPFLSHYTHWIWNLLTHFFVNVLWYIYCRGLLKRWCRRAGLSEQRISLRQWMDDIQQSPAMISISPCVMQPGTSFRI